MTAHVARILLVHNGRTPSDLAANLWGSGYLVETESAMPVNPGSYDLVVDAREGHAAPDPATLTHTGSVAKTLAEAHRRFPPVQRLSLSGAEVDLEARIASRSDGNVRLTETEVRLLRFLAAHPHRAISKLELLQKVWGYHSGAQSRTPVTTTHRLRQKIEARPGEPRNLRSVHGVGYRFVPSTRVARQTHAKTGPPGSMQGATPPCVDVPAPRDPLFGRDRLLLDVAERFRQARLVTLWGPPGVGKTRLAIETAHGSTFSGGATLVDLGRASGRAEAVATIAHQVGLQPDRDRSQQLRDRGEMLLILDNCEAVVEHIVDLVGTWLDKAPTMRIMVTSRTPLHLRGEQVVEVPPLACPRSPTQPEVAVSPAAQLFMARARAQRVALRLTDANASDVARIVGLLDGLPLAVELAARRCRTRSLTTLRERLEAGLEELVSEERDRSHRHRTMRATLDSSWDLLTADERRALRRLSEQADASASPSAVSIDPDDAGAPALDVLDRLVGHGLLLRRHDPDRANARYILLGLTRRYAARRCGTTDDQRMNHGDERGATLSLIGA